MKHLDPNDPRFTAKALGEEETQPINPEASDEFASLQFFSDTLRSELKARDEQDALTSEQKDRVRAAVEPPKKKVLIFPVWLNVAAACLALGLVGIFSFKVLDRSKDAILADIPLAADLDDEMSVHPSEAGKQDDGNTQAGGEFNQFRQRPAPIPETAALPPQMRTNEHVDQIRKQAREGQQAGREQDEEIFELAPFEVEETESQGYAAASTLAGSRVKAEIADLPGSITVATQESMNDAGASASANAMPVPATSKPEVKLANFETPETEPRLVARGPFPMTLASEPKKQESWNREAYDRIVENTFRNPTDHPLSTFSIDVDTASYAIMRRFLNNGSLPPADAVRIEELINYFSYDYAEPTNEIPFAVHVDAASAPWNENHRLVRIALQGETVDSSERPDANLVFLIDVSGSMSNPNKLPLVQRSLNLLVDQMEARDRIAVVVYAGASGLALPSTTANNKETIQHAIRNLKSGGSTNGGAGIELAYSAAQKHFIEDGINRVILCTDGDFNVGTTDRGGLTRLIEEKAETGVFFSVLGFGMGNYQDAAMEELSNKGNGNYGYVDSIKEARKLFVDEMLGTLFTIAKDVKIQVEFNPTKVISYRLIGYENRMLAKEDFNDDRKDAGEIGAGHRVTALYEVVPAGADAPETSSVDPLKYQAASTSERAVRSDELLTVKLRYKQPDADVSQLIEKPFIDADSTLAEASDDFRFASSVAAFGMLLRQSKYTESMTLDDVLAMANNAKGVDSGGLRSEFVELVEKAKALQPKEAIAPANTQPRE